MEKQCKKCKQYKSLDDFHQSRKFKDGRQYTCKQCKSEICQAHYIKNKEHCIQTTGNYYHNNKEKRVKWENNKLKTDSLFKLKKMIRHRLRGALRRISLKKDSSSAVKDLGCTIIELKQYLEAKFQPGMTWQNHTFYGWHIDHIIPMSSAASEEELRKLCHYTNLQPLWAKDNISKGNRLV